MSIKKLLNYISSGLFLIVLIGIFLDLLNVNSSSSSFWDISKSNGFAMFFIVMSLVLVALGIAVNLIGKYQELSFFVSGFMISVNLFVATIYFNSEYTLAVGFYFMLIGSICVLILNTINIFIKDRLIFNNNSRGQFNQPNYNRGMNNQYGSYQNQPMNNNKYNQYPNQKGYNQSNNRYGNYDNYR